MTAPEPTWIREDVVRAIHGRQIAEHGGRAGLRDAGALASALARPRNLFRYADPAPDLAALAAAYGVGIARNHPFVDGNKRVALVLVRVFLRLNGQELIAPPVEKYERMVALAAGETTEEQLADWIRNRLV